jgi:hypothetical protein
VMPPVNRLLFLFISVLLIAGPEVLAQEKPRIIKVLGTGKAEGMPILTAWFTTEPSTDPTIVPTREWGAVSNEEIRRFMRIYFPRTYDDLLDYEFFFLAQVDLAFLSAEQQNWIYRALTNYERGGVNTRSIMSAHDWLHIPWRDSVISQAFPNDVAAVMEDADNKEGKPGPLTVKDGPEIPEIMKPFKAPIEGLYRNYGGLNTIPKPGSVVLSYTTNNAGLGSPVPGQIAHVFYWRWNQSTTFTFRDMVYDPFWSAPTTGSAISNPYSLDIIANIIWFSTGRELPQDPLKVHDLRRDLFDYGIKKSLLTSLLDFAEIFGANPTSEYAAMDEVEDIRREAAQSYLDRDFETAYDLMKEALSELTKLEDSATKLKDRALLWVYVVEWSVTTGVLLVAGVILWTLMIKRALYREVKATKWTR